jgi:HAE1 family hydrophobic/amphiphilic exporter-1
MLFNFDFSLIALIGIILLIGIVKKNGIMMVDFAIGAERDQNLPAVEAIRRAAVLRFRPIMIDRLSQWLGRNRATERLGNNGLEPQPLTAE